MKNNDKRKPIKELPSQTVDLIKLLDEWYPDQMVVEDIDEAKRLKLAGKIELIRLLKRMATNELKEI